MKQIFRCEYCTEYGTAEEIMKHEEKCIYNYNKKSCLTCKYAENKFACINCQAGVELEQGKYMEGCSKYAWDERDHTISSSFSKMFGGGLF
jgi:sarcosine oxidase delta subunit